LTCEHRFKKKEYQVQLFEPLVSPKLSYKLDWIHRIVHPTHSFSDLLHIIFTTIYRSCQWHLCGISAEIPRKCWCCVSLLSIHHQTKWHISDSPSNMACAACNVIPLNHWKCSFP